MASRNFAKSLRRGARDAVLRAFMACGRVASHRFASAHDADCYAHTADRYAHTADCSPDEYACAADRYSDIHNRR